MTKPVKVHPADGGVREHDPRNVVPRTVMVTRRIAAPLREVTGTIRTLDHYAALTEELEAQYAAILALVRHGVAFGDSVGETVALVLAQAREHLGDDAVRRLEAGK